MNGLKYVCGTCGGTGGLRSVCPECNGTGLSVHDSLSEFEFDPEKDCDCNAD